MMRVAFGQGKMISRPVAGILHFIVYISFIIINIELVEIIIDGIFELEICNETVPDLDTAKTELDKILVLILSSETTSTFSILNF